jgi:hypothetical protein
MEFKDKLSQVLENSPNLDYCERPFFRTALWEATWKNHEDIVRLLVEKKASVHVEDYQQRTPLHEAAYYGHANLVNFLIDQGHPVNCADKFGQTPLFRAVEAGRRAVVELLVQRGADVALLDRDNVTAHHIAAFQGMPQLSEWLLYQGAFKNRFEISETRPSGGKPIYDKTPRHTPDPVRRASVDSTESTDTLIDSTGVNHGSSNLNSSQNLNSSLKSSLRKPLGQPQGPQGPQARRRSSDQDDVGFANRTGNKFIKELTMKVH